MAKQLLVVKGSGVVGDARSLTPRCSATLISCMRWRIPRETCVMLHVRTTTTTTRHLHSSVAFSRVACCVDVKRAAHGCTRWRRCSAAQGPPAPLVLATRADDRADGTGGGSASVVWSQVDRTKPYEDRRPPEQLGRRLGVLEDPAPQGAVTVGNVAAPGPLPLLTGAGGHCSRSSGRARTAKFLL